MALYPPPRENVPIFDTSNFTIDNTALTVDSGLDYFLAYPTAQGSQTMSNTTVAGTLTALGSVNFSSTTLGSLTSSALQPPSNDSSTRIPTTAWVQTAVSGGGGAASTLSQVLLAGNSAGATSINMNNNDILNIKDLEVDASADFNSSVNVDGLTTMNNVLNMNGGSVGLSSIQTRELRLKDTVNGNNNGSKLSTTTNVLTLDSVGPNATNTVTDFTLRNTANTVITPLQLTTTINNMNVPLDMTGGNSSLSTIRSRVYNFKNLGTGAATNSTISLDNTIMILDNQQSNSSMEFRTRTSGGGGVTSLRIESSQMFSNVPLDMTNNDVTLLGYLNASIRSRIYLLRDLTTAAITSCGMYFSGNILQIDSDSGIASTDTSMFLRTKKASGTLTNALQLTNTTVKTDCYAITALPANDNSNSIPTTTWVQSLLSSYIPTIPANYAERAYLHYCGTQLNPNTTDALWSINIPNITYEQNDFISFHLTFSCNRLPSTAPNNFYLSQRAFTYSADIDIYPYRIVSSNAGWCYNNTGNSFAEVTTNQINGNAAYNVIIDNPPTPYAKYGRQFWSYGAIYTYYSGDPSSNQRIYINGDPGNLYRINFRVPYPGDNWTYTASLVLLTPVIGSGAGSPINITTSGFNVNL